jgi:hypothetical protein
MVKEPFTDYPQARHGNSHAIGDARTPVALFQFENDQEYDGYQCPDKGGI